MSSASQGIGGRPELRETSSQKKKKKKKKRHLTLVLRSLLPTGKSSIDLSGHLMDESIPTKTPFATPARVLSTCRPPKVSSWRFIAILHSHGLLRDLIISLSLTL